MNQRYLFICGKAKMRSPTAADLILAQTGIAARCGGTSRDAEEPVAHDDITWATHIFCMESVHKKKLNRQFDTALRDTPIRVLGIKDNYAYMQAELIAILSTKLGLDQ